MDLWAPPGFLYCQSFVKLQMSILSDPPWQVAIGPEAFVPVDHKKAPPSFDFDRLPRP